MRATLAWLFITLFAGCYVYTGPRIRVGDYRWDTDRCSFYPAWSFGNEHPRIYCLDEGAWEYHPRSGVWVYIGD